MNRSLSLLLKGLGLSGALLASQQTLAQNACTTLSPSSLSVPSCPTSSLLAENLYPPMAISISDSDGGSEWVAKFVETVLKADPQKPPQFLIAGSSLTVEAVRVRIEASSVDAKTKGLWLQSITAVKDEDGGYNWQQDFYQPYVNPNTGKPVLREVVQYRQRGYGDLFTPVMAAAKASCGIEKGDGLSEQDRGLVGGQMGGNIEGGPGGLCLLGDDHFEGSEWAAYAKSACGGGKPVKVPTHFLFVGHTDEIVTTVRVPGKKAPCNFAIMIASPKLGLETLRKRPSQNFFGYENSEPEADLKKVSSYRALKKLCAKALSTASPQNSKPSSPKSRGSSRAVSWYDLIFERVSLGSPAQAQSEESREALACDSMPTNAQMADMLAKDSELASYNELVQETIDQFKKDYASELKVANPSCGEPDFIDVPNLFMGDVVEKNGKLELAQGSPSSGHAILANPSNNIQVGETLIFPDPGNEAFRQSLAGVAKAQGLQAKFVDTFFAHKNQGNLHCSTNAIRYCRPQTPSANLKRGSR